MLFLLLLSSLAYGSEYDFKETGPKLWASRFSRAEAFRYHTHYNIKIKEDDIPGMPWVEEDCHDDSNRFFNWSKSVTFSMQYSGSVGFSLLGFEVGLGADIGKETQVSFERWVQASRGIRARHVLKKRYEVWEGVTYKETFWDNGSVTMSPEGEPFLLSYVNPGLIVKREVLERCDEEP